MSLFGDGCGARQQWYFGVSTLNYYNKQ